VEHPYQPPKAEGAEKESPAALWSQRSRAMVMLMSVLTSLTGITLAWFSRGYEVVLRLAEDEAPAFFREWLQFAWRDPQLPFWCGGFLGSVALAFLHLEKRIMALVLALLGAVIVGGWAGVLLAGLAHLVPNPGR
jgi:hypothetical protein